MNTTAATTSKIRQSIPAEIRSSIYATRGTVISVTYFLQNGDDAEAARVALTESGFEAKRTGSSVRVWK